MFKYKRLKDDAISRIGEYELYIDELHQRTSINNPKDNTVLDILFLTRKKQIKLPDINALTRKEKIEYMREKYNRMLELWNAYERMVRYEDYTGAAACFSTALTMGFSKAKPLYRKKLIIMKPSICHQK